MSGLSHGCPSPTLCAFGNRGIISRQIHQLHRPTCPHLTSPPIQIRVSSYASTHCSLGSAWQICWSLGNELRLLPLSSLPAPSPPHTFTCTHRTQIINIKELSRPLFKDRVGGWQVLALETLSPCLPQTRLATTLRGAGLTQTPVSGIA